MCYCSPRCPCQYVRTNICSGVCGGPCRELMTGTAARRSGSLRVQPSTAPTSLVPIRTIATRGVVCGSSPLRNRQFRLLIWSSAARQQPS